LENKNSYPREDRLSAAFVQAQVKTWLAGGPDTPAGRYPVLLLSRDEAYSIRELVIVAAVTTRMRHIPSEVPLDASDGLPKACAVNLDILTAIARATLQEKMTSLRSEKLKSVDAVIYFVPGLAA
jgi:mRNA interferase MazF